MTATEAAFVRRLQRRTREMTPDAVKRILDAYEAVRRLLTDRELADAIRSGVLDEFLDDVLDDSTSAKAFGRLRFGIVQDATAAAASEATTLPSAVVASFFNRLSPFVVQAADALASRVVDGIRAEVRETIRQVARDGLAAGEGPRVTARRMRAALGLAPNQEAAVANFRRMISQDDATALTRKLRDRRYDATLRRGNLTPAQIDTMTAAYRRRMLAFNAETHARTLALDTQKLAQRLAWQDAIERGVVSPLDLVREWIAVGGPQGDGRNRPEHLDMHGERAGWDEPFRNGELVPGDSTYNCRCLARTVLQRARVAA